MMFLSRPVFQQAIEFAVGGSNFPESQLHGQDHWRAVAAQGIALATELKYPPKARYMALLFGLFHDSRRVNDDYDPEHGARAAQAFKEFFSGEREALCDAVFLDQMTDALVYHDKGRNHSDPMVSLGWDADRSCLGRCGITPALSFFSIVPERLFEGFVRLGGEHSYKAPSWDALYDHAVIGNYAQSKILFTLSRQS